MGKAFARTGYMPPRQHPWAQPKSDAYYRKLSKKSTPKPAASEFRRDYGAAR